MPTISTVAEFNAALEAGQYAWPGGYPMFFVTSDGEAMSFKAAREEAEQIREAIRTNANDGWRVVGYDVNWEDGQLFCCHSGERIESAYAEDDKKD